MGKKIVLTRDLIPSTKLCPALKLIPRPWGLRIVENLTPVGRYIDLDTNQVEDLKRAIVLADFLEPWEVVREVCYLVQVTADEAQLKDMATSLGVEPRKIPKPDLVLQLNDMYNRASEENRVLKAEVVELRRQLKKAQSGE